MENTEKGFRYSETSDGIHNTLSWESYSRKNSKTPHMNLAQRQQVQVEIIMLKKGSFARPVILNGSF